MMYIYNYLLVPSEMAKSREAKYGMQGVDLNRGRGFSRSLGTYCWCQSGWQKTRILYPWKIGCLQTGSIQIVSVIDVLLVPQGSSYQATWAT